MKKLPSHHVFLLFRLSKSSQEILPSNLARWPKSLRWAHGVAFGSTRYWRFNEEMRTMDPGYPKPITIWRGVPDSPQGAFVDKANGTIRLVPLKLGLWLRPHVPGRAGRAPIDPPANWTASRGQVVSIRVRPS